MEWYWVRRLVYFGAGALILYFARGRRTKWAPPAAIACFVAAGFLTYMKISETQQSQTAAKAAPAGPQAKFDAAATTATADVVFRGDGFSLIIPAGYRYAPMDPPTLLMATRGDRATEFTIVTNAIDGQAEPVVRKVLEDLKKGNGTYEFSELAVDKDEMRAWCHVTKDGIPLRGLFLFVPRYRTLWQMTLTQPSTSADANLKRIADSLLIK